MEGDNSAEGLPKIQPVLGDITNQLGKRGLSKISGKSGSKIGDDEGDSHFTQRVCQREEDMVKEKCEIQSTRNDDDNVKRVCISPRPCSEINSPRVPMASGSSSSSKGKCSQGEEGALLKVAEGEVSVKDYEGTNVGNFTVGKHGMVECSSEPHSQVPKSFQLEKCRSLVVDGSFSSSVGVDLIKACSCSFCVKAAYIWSDLHYQDIKGRIAALKKSQKEASVAHERTCRNKGIDKQSQGNCYKMSKLESDLMGLWRSLFLHMEDIFEREGNELEASLLALKDLRENCKTELEMVNGMPKDKH